MENFTLTGHSPALRELFDQLKGACTASARCEESARSEHNQRITDLRGAIVGLCSRPLMPISLEDVTAAADRGAIRYIREVAQMSRDFVASGGRLVVYRHSLCASVEELRIIDDAFGVEEFFSIWVGCGW